MNISSNLFGQSSDSTFVTPSVFEQNNNPNNPISTQTLPVSSATSAPVFGSSTPAFGSSSTPAFGNSSSSSHGSTIFGQITTSGGFGSTTPLSPFGSPFGGPLQQSKPAFKSNDSLPIWSTSQPAFTTNKTPAFGTTNIPTFGSTSTPTFGTSGFGFSIPAFGGTNSSFGFWSTPTSGQSTSAFATSSPFDSTTSTFVWPKRSPFETDDTNVVSISARPACNGKTHEELRWDYYHVKNLGRLNPAARSSGEMGFNTQQTNPFVSSPSTNPFAPKTSPFCTENLNFSLASFCAATSNSFRSKPTPSAPFGPPSTNMFAPKTSPFVTTGFKTTTSSLGSTSNPFWSRPSPAPLAFGPPSTDPFAPKTLPFGTKGFESSTSSLGSSPFCTATSNPFWSKPTPSPAPSVFGSAPAFASTTSTTSAFSNDFEKLDSISAMNALKEKSHEELKWEFCQFANKGGMGFNMNNTQQTNPFDSSSSANPFNITISTNPFAPNATSTLGSSPSTLVLVLNFKNMNLT